MMKKGSLLELMCVFGVLCYVAPRPLAAVTMGTGFTYQGRLTDSFGPADGSYDFTFSLFDALTNGAQQGSTITRDDVDVDDGYFTVELDFGGSVFGGDARWLQISVREGVEQYRALAPRQELTPGPYSLYSESTAGITVSSGNVGIGTTDPGYLLTTADTGTTTAANLANVVYVDAANERLGIGFAYPTCTLDIRTSSGGPGINFQGPSCPDVEIRSTTGNVSVVDFSNDSSIDYDMRIWLTGDNSLAIDGGNFGIGTAAPTEKLDVSGVVRCVDLVETSDEQLKADVQPLGSVLGKLEQVRAVSFRWNEKAQALGATVGTREIGVLAQELEQAFPELVTTPEPVALDELLKGCSEEILTPETRQRLQESAERTHYKAVSYSKLTVVLLEAVKELQAKNESLEQRIQALEGKGR